MLARGRRQRKTARPAFPHTIHRVGCAQRRSSWRGRWGSRTERAEARRRSSWPWGERPISLSSPGLSRWPRLGWRCASL